MMDYELLNSRSTEDICLALTCQLNHSPLPREDLRPIFDTLNPENVSRQNIGHLLATLERRADFVQVMAKNASAFNHIFAYICSIDTIKDIIKLAPPKELFDLMTLHNITDLIENNFDYIRVDFGSILEATGRLPDIFSQFQTLNPPNYECLEAVVTPELIATYIVPIATATYTFHQIVMLRGGEWHLAYLYRDFYFEYFRLNRPTPPQIQWLVAYLAENPDVRFFLDIMTAADQFLGTSTLQHRKINHLPILKLIRSQPRAAAYLLSKRLASNPALCSTLGDFILPNQLFNIGDILMNIVRGYKIGRFLDALDDLLVFPFPLEVILPDGNNLLHYATTHNGFKIVQRAIHHLNHRITQAGSYLDISVSSIF